MLPWFMKLKFWERNHHSNEDISAVPTSEIPDHDLLVGGFPCQDYSVATTLHNSKGLEGKKGVFGGLFIEYWKKKRKNQNTCF